MAGTQAPKGFGLLFILVGIPLILWSASGTNESMAALDTREAREARCIQKIAHVPLSPENAQAICGCTVRKAEEQGITQSGGAYDEEAIRPIVESCYAANIPG